MLTSKFFVAALFVGIVRAAAVDPGQFSSYGNTG